MKKVTGSKLKRSKRCTACQTALKKDAVRYSCKQCSYHLCCKCVTGTEGYAEAEAADKSEEEDGYSAPPASAFCGMQKLIDNAVGTYSDLQQASISTLQNEIEELTGEGYVASDVDALADKADKLDTEICQALSRWTAPAGTMREPLLREPIQATRVLAVGKVLPYDAAEEYLSKLKARAQTAAEKIDRLQPEFDSIARLRQEAEVTIEGLKEQVAACTKTGSREEDVKTLEKHLYMLKKEVNDLRTALNPSLRPQDVYAREEFFFGDESDPLQHEELLEQRLARALQARKDYNEEAKTLVAYSSTTDTIEDFASLMPQRKAKLDTAKRKVSKLEAQKKSVEEETTKTENSISAVNSKLSGEMIGRRMQMMSMEQATHTRNRMVGVSAWQSQKAELDSVNNEIREKRSKLRSLKAELAELYAHLKEQKVELYKLLAQRQRQLAGESVRVGPQFITDEMRDLVGPDKAKGLFTAFFVASHGQPIDGPAFESWLKSFADQPLLKAGGPDGEDRYEVNSSLGMMVSDEPDTEPEPEYVDSDFGEDEKAASPEEEEEEAKPCVRIFKEALIGAAFNTNSLEECKKWFGENGPKLRGRAPQMHNEKLVLNWMAADAKKAKVSISYDYDYKTEAYQGVSQSAVSKFTLTRRGYLPADDSSWACTAMDFKRGYSYKHPLPEIPVREGTTVGALRASVAEMFGIPAQGLLMYTSYGQLWNDDKPLNECKCNLGDTVRINSNAKQPLVMGSEEHLAELTESFPFKGFIEKTEKRGITLAQLKRILAFLEAHSGMWRDSNEHSSTKGWTLELDSINLYHVNDWLILPSTKSDNCALVELLTDKDQPPHNFVSHWWGEPVQDFIKCVAHHAEVRQLKEDMHAYWVCAYANRQHDLGAELTVDPRKTSFYKALGLAIGVLLILDSRNDLVSTGPATPFTRVWCCFEESIAVNDTTREVPLKLDIATTIPSQRGLQVTVITDGLAGKEDRGKLGWGEKGQREASFPVQVLEAGLKVDILKSAASVASDKTHILNSIAGLPIEQLDDKPLEDSPNYAIVNNRLSGIFAVSGFRSAIQSGVDLKDYTAALLKDEDRTELQLNFAEMGGAFQDASLKPLTDEHLDALGEGLAGLQSVTKFDLALDSAAEITDGGLERLCEGIGRMSKLETFILSLDFCKGIENPKTMGKSLGKLKNLKNLKISGFLTGLSEVEFIEGLEGCTVLEKLQLQFPNTMSYNNPNGRPAAWRAAARTLGRLQCLVHLDISFKSGYSITPHCVRDLALGVERLKNLKLFRLNLEGIRMLYERAVECLSWKSAEQFVADGKKVTQYLDGDEVEVNMNGEWEDGYVYRGGLEFEKEVLEKHGLTSALELAKLPEQFTVRMKFNVD